MQPSFTFTPAMNRFSLSRIVIAITAAVVAIAGCKPAGIETGNAGGLATGAAGQKQSTGETRKIEKCDTPLV